MSLTSSAATDWNPVWSPDGRYFYFASDRGGAMNLWRVPVDEESGRLLGEPQAITTPTSYIAHLSISADGRRLAYSSIQVAANIGRITLNTVTGSVQGETGWVTTGSRSWSSPDPSPDGQWVTFYSRLQPEGDLYVRCAPTGARCGRSRVTRPSIACRAGHPTACGFCSFETAVTDSISLESQA